MDAAAKQEYIEELERREKARVNLTILAYDRYESHTADTWVVAGYVSRQGELLCFSCGVPFSAFQMKVESGDYPYVCERCET